MNSHAPLGRFDNAIIWAGLGPGDVAAIFGIGRLEHQGVQFAARMGCVTVAMARGGDKEALAWNLGAQH